MNEADRERRARSIDEAFPHRVCINLERRPERWREMRAKFERHGIHAVRRFAALDGRVLDIPPHWVHTPGAYGCRRSHVSTSLSSAAMRCASRSSRSASSSLRSRSAVSTPASSRRTSSS